MATYKVTNQGGEDRHQFEEELIGDGLSFSDYFDEKIPYDVKPVPNLVPMEEMDFPIQAKDIFSTLSQESPSLQMSPLIKESDAVRWGGKYYSWDEDAAAIFIVYDEKEKFYVASVFDYVIKKGFYSNWQELEYRLNKKSDVFDAVTHSDLELAVETHSDEYPGANSLQGRLFKIDDPGFQYIMGFWEPANVVRTFQSFIEEWLNRIGVDPTKILWAHSDGLAVISHKQMFRSKAKLKSRSKEQLELLKKIHIDAVLKKKVLQLPPHPFQLLADKLGVTTAQLRQLAGSMDEETTLPTADERMSLCENMQRGAGFWLDTNGVFYDVDKKPFTGHVSFAKHHLKNPDASYPHMFEKGYVWVGVFADWVGFNYGTPPSALQMYLLKKEAVDSKVRLYDLVKKEYIDTSLLKETEELNYKANRYSYNTHGYSVMVLFKMDKVAPSKTYWWTENVESKIPNLFYLAAINDDKYVSDWPELEGYAQNRFTPGYAETHSDVMGVVEEYLNRSRPTDAFEHSELQARIFQSDDFPGGFAIGFWEPFETVKAYRKQVFDYLKRIGLTNYKECLWTADGGVKVLTYGEFWGEVQPTTDPRQVALMKLQHLNAIAKKKLLGQPVNKLQRLADSMGITVVQLRQKLGSMDEVEGARNVDGEVETWDHGSAKAIFTIFDSDKIIVQERNGNSAEYYTNIKGIENVLNTDSAFQKNPAGADLGYNFTHYAMFKHAVDACAKVGNTDFTFKWAIDKFGKYESYHGHVSARVFVFPEGKTVVGFWQRIGQIRPWWSEIEKVLKKLDVDIEHAVYTFENLYSRSDDEFSYEFVTGKTVSVPKRDPRELALMKIMHLSPEAKKAFLKNPNNNLQHLADTMGISLPQLRQKLGSMDENVNASLNATLIWLEKDGTIHDTNEIQHGIYVADNPGMFGVSYDFVEKVFKKHGEDYDEAAAIMCEQAFKKKWMRVVKVPWRNKILVEGQEPTREQRRVFEDWFFEDKSVDIIWQQWVSSKFGPPHPVTLFSSKNVLETTK